MTDGTDLNIIMNTCKNIIYFRNFKFQKELQDQI